MSIILKGIDMPKENQICKIEIHPDGHCAVMKIEEGDCYSLEFNSETKAIQIDRPHGRIIDGDKLKEKRETMCWREPNYTPHESDFVDTRHIDNAPTILEAED